MMKSFGLAVVLASMLAGPALAKKNARMAGPFPVSVISVTDGDTVVVEVVGACPFGCITDTSGAQIISIRLAGVDTGETRLCKKSINNSCAACPAERAEGLKAKQAVQDFLKDQSVVLINVSPDKYSGRVVGDLTVKGQSASQLLLKRGLARPYDGKAKTKSWCAAKLALFVGR
jgi:micrococcal nuclease